MAARSAQANLLRLGQSYRRTIVRRFSDGSPPTVSSEERHVLTPRGFRPQSLVHRVEYRHRLLATAKSIRQFDANGILFREFPRVIFKSALVPGIDEGWITYAYWANGTGQPLTRFRTSWQVPPAPSTQSGQTVFLFNAIEDAAGNDILQPVLQWGASAAGGGSEWAVASWYIDPNGDAFYTEPVTVKEGDALTGVMTIGVPQNGSFACTSAFEGIDGATIAVDTSTELVWCSETLEAYGITQRSDYPNAAVTRMTAIDISTAAGTAPVSWTPATPVSDYGQSTEIPASSDPSGEVDLGYGPPTAPPPPPPTPAPASPRAAKPADFAERSAKAIRRWSTAGFFALLLALLVVSYYFYTQPLVGTDAKPTAHFVRYWLGVTAIITSLALLAGFMAKRLPLGLFIDERNRMSLSRFQLIVWSIVIVSAYYVTGLWDYELGQGMPAMQATLWGLLGIPGGAAALNPLILGTKDAQQSNQPVTGDGGASGNGAGGDSTVLHTNPDSKDASWTDFFYGEEKANADTVDVTRLQQFIFTILLVLTYLAALLDVFSRESLNPKMTLQMPDLGTTALALLSIANGTYLVTKSINKPAKGG